MCIEDFVVYLNIIKRGNETWSAAGYGESGEGLYFALHWVGNFKMSRCLVGRLTCAPVTTVLTPQLGRISESVIDR